MLHQTRSVSNGRSRTPPKQALLPPAKEARLHSDGMQVAIPSTMPLPPDHDLRATADGASASANGATISQLSPSEGASLRAGSPTPPKRDGPSSIEDLPNIVEQSVKKHTGGLATQIQKSTDEHCTKILTDFNEQIGKRLSTMEGKISGLDSSVSDLVTGQEDIKKQLDKLSHAMSALSASKSTPNLHSAAAPSAGAIRSEVASSQQRSDPDDITAPRFWRAPCPKTLVINVMDRIEITPKALEESLVPLLTDANCDPSAVKIVGDQLGWRFEVVFPSNASCKQFHGSLKLGPRKYKPTDAATPGGQIAKYFVNPDKNGATVRMEIQSKQLFTIVQDMLEGSAKVFPCRDTGSVLCQRQELCAVVVESQHKSGIAWNKPLAARLGLDRTKVEAAFAETSGGLSYP